MDVNFHSLSIDSGAILVDANKQTAQIDIFVIQDSKKPFAHNGVYKMRSEL